MKRGIALMLLVNTLVAVSQYNDTTLADTSYLNIDDEVYTNFDANLDSLLNLWYVNSAGNTLASIDSSVYTDSLFSSIPDSVFIDRLSRIPSVVDLTYNKIVRRYIEVYANKRRDKVASMLGLSEYYFPVFDDIFDYYDVPNEMKYMSIIESALNPRAYSRARAVGLWQFMMGTGKMYGLTVNSYVDERRDPIKSTHAAARFSSDLHKIYGDWTLVIAAYNCGPGNVNKAIRRSGGKRNFWDIYYYLPRETRGHVPAFIAATYIMHYYGEHNIVPVKSDLPIASDTIMINDQLHLDQVAQVLQLELKQLKDMNPQYRYDIIPGKHKPYALRLPMDKVTPFIEMEDSIFAYNDSVYFNDNDVTKAPLSASKTHYEPPSDKYTKLYYTVKSGDNPGYIASWYGVRLSDLNYWNNIRRNIIRVGQKLVVYVPNSKADKYKKVNEMSFAEKQKMIGKVVSTAPQTEPEPLGDDFFYYTVKSGDSLWEIAKKYPGVSDTDIMHWNNITDAAKINPGQKLKIKKTE
jgi:membrane-bound lytic murein transglycosylase D